MCDICMSFPCLPGCPNAADPAAVYRCKCCGENILKGEECVELDGEFYHQECFSDSAVLILMEEYGAVNGVADVERWVW